MKNYGRIRGPISPSPIEITPTAVFIASDIQAYTDTVEGHNINGYEYNYVEYSKDEYLLQQSNQIQSLQEQLAAAKILLGVD